MANFPTNVPDKEYNEPDWEPDYNAPHGPVNPVGYEAVEAVQGVGFGMAEVGPCFADEYSDLENP